MKRFLSAFIAILLVVSLMPLSAFAATGDVAKIGDTGYATLADAIKAAPKNTDRSATAGLLTENGY